MTFWVWLHGINKVLLVGGAWDRLLYAPEKAGATSSGVMGETFQPDGRVDRRRNFLES
jgi:hypothetical protein